MPKVEHRSLQIRAAQGEEFVLAGRALTYNEISSNELAPGLRERIIPGAFADSLASGTDVKALLNHNDRGLPLGRLANRTLKISDSANGLDFKIQLDKNNQSHRDVYASVKRGDISECSFAFYCEDEDVTDGYTKDGQRCQIRNVKKARLQDVSVVTQPFYGDNATSVDARNAGTPDAAGMARLKAIDEKFATDLWLIEATARAKKLGEGIQDPLNPEATPNDDEEDSRDLQVMQDSLNQAHGRYSVIGKSDCYVYGMDTENEEDAVHRWAYSRDDAGQPCIDHDSHAVLSDIEDVDSRGYCLAKAELRARRADAEYQRRARALTY